MKRENNICFTDSGGKALFSIPDGGMIKLSYGNGDENYAICRYQDKDHAEIDGVSYALTDFAKRMERNQSVLRLLKDTGRHRKKEVHHTWLRNIS